MPLIKATLLITSFFLFISFSLASSEQLHEQNKEHQNESFDALNIKEKLAVIEAQVVAQPKEALASIIELKENLKYKDKLTPNQIGQLIRHEVLSNTYLNRHQVALSVIEEIKVLADSENDTASLWHYYNLKAIVYWYMNNIEDSLSFHLKAYDAVKSIEKYTNFQSTSSGNVGYALIKLGFFQEAIPYIESTMEAAMKSDTTITLASSYNNLGEAYLGLKDYQKALTLVQKSLALRLEHNLTFHSSYSYHNLGLIYFALQQFAQAEIEFKKAIEIRDEVGFVEGSMSSKLGLVKTYIKINDIVSAEEALSAVILEAKNQKSNTTLSEAYDLQRQIYAKKADFQNAYQTSLLYESTLEQVVSRKTTEKLASYLNTSSAIRKDLNILTLEKDAEIKALQVANERKNMNIMLAFGFCIVIILSVFLWTVQQSKKVISRSNQNLSLTLTELKETQEKLVKSGKMSVLTTLVSRMAHQVNTPLGIALTSVSHISEKVEHFEQLVATGGVKKSAINGLLTDLTKGCDLSSRSMNKVVDLISQFKMISDNLEAETQVKFEIVDLLTKQADLILMSIKQHQPSINVSGSKVFIVGFPEAVGKIFSQLIANSIDHAFETTLEPKINIAITKKHDHVNITYQDNGKGIDSAIVNDVFEPFYTTTMGNKNLGIGLSIVYNLVVQLMQGNIQCKQTQGSGTMFCITLPLIAEPI